MREKLVDDDREIEEERKETEKKREGEEGSKLMGTADRGEFIKKLMWYLMILVCGERRPHQLVLLRQIPIP